MAKKKPAEPANVKTTKTKRRRRIVARKRSASSALRANPPPLQDLVEFILPGFGGYAATRLLSRIAYVQLSKKWPKLAPHLAVGSTVATAAAAWLLVHRVKRLERFHTPVVVGSAIAAIQAIIQTYIPKLGWMISDVQGADLPAAKPAPMRVAAPSSPDVDDLSDIDMDEVGSLSGTTIPDVDPEGFIDDGDDQYDAAPN